LPQCRKQAGVKGRRLNSLYAVLGSVVSGGALICLLQKIFRVGLAPVLAEGMGSFQEIVHFFTEPIMTVLAGVLPFAVPEWYCDLWVISFVLTLVNLQGALIGVKREGKAWLVAARTFLYIFFGVCILGLAALNAFVLLGLAMPFLALRDLRNKSEAATAKTCLMSVVLAMLITAAFFALNSQLQDPAIAASQEGARSLPVVTPPL
jgi:hypothetical protein